MDLRDRTYAAKTLVSLFFWCFFGAGLVFELMQTPEVSEESEWRTQKYSILFDGLKSICFYRSRNKSEFFHEIDEIDAPTSSIPFFRDLLGALLRIVMELPKLAKCRRLEMTQMTFAAYKTWSILHMSATC